MGFPAVHWQYEDLDGASAVYRILVSRYRQRVKSALLLVVEGIDAAIDPAGDPVKPVVAADPLGAKLGEEVVVAFGKAARVACGGDGDFAFEAAIVGIVDDHHVPSHPEWRRPEDGDAGGAV